MSCNGCRVLRKGCSETCILRPCIQWIESAESQGHATVFVAKFFGRAGLMNFISSVPESQRPALFRSLLFEACGRTVNPVNGAVGLLWTGNWNACQAAVETVLHGGTLRPLPELLGRVALTESDDVSEVGCSDIWNSHPSFLSKRGPVVKRKRLEEALKLSPPSDLDLRLTSSYVNDSEKLRPPTPSSEDSVTTEVGILHGDPVKLLNLFT